jgi:dihydrofolate reductase
VSGLQFEGYAIVSADGMLADATGIMPSTLKFDADQTFLSDALDDVDLIVHGRNSFEDQPNSPRRRRIYATRTVHQPAASPDINSFLWNPAHAPIETAAALAGVTSGRIAIIGGTSMFDMFLDRYQTFWLSYAPRVQLPGGVPVFTHVPAQGPEAILRDHGLMPSEQRILDASNDVHVVKWTRGSL